MSGYDDTFFDDGDRTMYNAADYTDSRYKSKKTNGSNKAVKLPDPYRIDRTMNVVEEPAVNLAIQNTRKNRANFSLEVILSPEQEAIVTNLYPKLLTYFNYVFHTQRAIFSSKISFIGDDISDVTSQSKFYPPKFSDPAYENSTLYELTQINQYDYYNFYQPTIVRAVQQAYVESKLASTNNDYTESQISKIMKDGGCFPFYLSASTSSKKNVYSRYVNMYYIDMVNNDVEHCIYSKELGKIRIKKTAENIAALNNLYQGLYILNMRIHCVEDSENPGTFNKFYLRFKIMTKQPTCIADMFNYDKSLYPAMHRFYVADKRYITMKLYNFNYPQIRFNKPKLQPTKKEFDEIYINYRWADDL